MTELAISLIRKSKLRLFMAVDFNNETILIFYPLRIPGQAHHRPKTV